MSGIFNPRVFAGKPKSIPPIPEPLAGGYTLTKKKKNFATIFTIVFFYVTASATLYDLQEPNLPQLVQYFIEYFTLPFRYMFRPLYPALKPFGLVVSDAAELPTPWGIVAGSIFYMVVLFALTWMFSAKPVKRRPYEEPWDH